jgi:hypothetical protein
VWESGCGGDGGDTVSGSMLAASCDTAGPTAAAATHDSDDGHRTGLPLDTFEAWNTTPSASRNTGVGGGTGLLDGDDTGSRWRNELGRTAFSTTALAL